MKDIEYTKEMIDQAKIVLLVIEQYRRNVRMERNHVILRESIGNILNTIANVVAGHPNMHGAKPDARSMSCSFYEKWKDKPTQANLRNIGIYEHRLPMGLVRKQLIDMSDADEISIIDFIKNEVKCAWITFDEDKKLKELGLNARMAEGGDRYLTATIALHNDGNPQQYLGRAKRKQ